MRKIFILTILISGALCSAVFGQWDDGGRLNAWTSSTISRQNNDSRETPYLKEVRVARNRGFDRVVFEFTGDIPRYQIEYINAPITGTADQEIKVAGKYFLSINLQMLPYPDDEKLARAKIPTGRLNFPAVS